MKKARWRNKGRFFMIMTGILILVSGGLLSCGLGSNGTSGNGWGDAGKNETADSSTAGQEERAEQISIYQDWSNVRFLSCSDNEEIELTGKTTVLIYWASWCPHCRDSAEQISTAATLAKEAGAQLYMVNKLDGEKETKETAEAFMRENGIQADMAYDGRASAYQEKGLHMLPTAIVLNENGMVTSFEEGQVPAESRLLSMIEEAEKGKSGYLAASIQKNLLTGEGGIRTNYLEGDGTVPSGADELSESMGLMLGYAAGSQDRDLFNRLYSRLIKNGLALENGRMYPWVVTDKQKITVNAAVDDFRIYRALLQAEEVWKDVNETDILEGVLYISTVQDKRLVDFYDITLKEAANTLTLCYADFKAIRLLAKQDRRWDEIYRAALETVQGGRISDEFPLYYRQYDYNSGTYNKDAFNMAEELVTLLHLAEDGNLPDDAYRWVTEQLYEGVIYAGYGVDGRPSLDKRYESTAVYALAGLLAMEKGDLSAARRALTLMEPLRVRDNSNILDGLFGGEDGNGIYSFDQCVALAAYQQMDEIMAE